MDLKIASIVKALAYTENGGKPNLAKPSAGKTGEMKSVFQFTPDTWKIYAKQITGQDNIPLTTENEAAVTYAKVANWYKQLKSEGVSDEEIPLKIASMWNAGEHRPDAYKQNFKGVNKKYGVAYDTPAYAKKVASYAKQFEKENPVDPQKDSKVATSNKNQGLIPTPPVQTNNPSSQPGVMPPQMKQARQV